jgi:hypothetical protein
MLVEGDSVLLARGFLRRTYAPMDGVVREIQELAGVEEVAVEVVEARVVVVHRHPQRVMERRMGVL